MSHNHVSIIMPCHNGSPYISDAIKSVQAQTFAKWELLIIDDCSTDDSLSIIKTFTEEDERISLFQTEKSTGFPADVRNVGIQAASGRYIAFLDCDDFWLPTKLERQMPLFDNDDVAVVFSWYLKMDEKGNHHKKPIKSPRIVDYKNLLGGNVIGNLTGMYDTIKVGKIFQKQIHHEDYLMWLEILGKGYVATNTSSVEGIYRECKKSVSGNKIKAIIWTFQIFYRELHFSRIKSILYMILYMIKAFYKFIK